MAHPESQERNFLKTAFQAGPECPPIERLAELADGSLSAAEQTVTREHADSCPRCRTELALLREFVEGEARNPKEAAEVAWITAKLRHEPPPQVQPTFWEKISALFAPGPRGLAWAGALLVLITTGLYFSHGTDPGSPVYQGGGELRSGAVNLISPVGEQQGVPSEFRWQAHAGADLYRVEVFDVDGISIWRSETKSTSVKPPARLLAPGRAFSWKVSAISRTSTVVGTSILQNFHIPFTRPAPIRE